MIFGDFAFLIFLAVATLTNALLGCTTRSLIGAMLGALFYAYYAPGFILPLAIITLLSWLILFAPDFLPSRTSSGGIRWSAVLCTVAVACFLGILGYYKYRVFFLDSILRLPAPKISAPLAISFFSFEFIHVAIERRRGNLSRLSLGNYAYFIFFFPTMIAGPIKRYQQFERDIGAPRIGWNDALEGCIRILLGLLKKMVVADNLNTIIQEIGGPLHTRNPWLLAASVLLYGFRIYYDFSGYSDVAIGASRLLGFHVPENFLQPYLQTNISRFWRSWHVSLYSWLIDYLYIPLGGSRHGLARSMINMLVVMMLSGLWHGAAWNFVMWGAWHGGLLAIHRLYADRLRQALPPSLTSSRAYALFCHGLTMICVWLGWMLFMWNTKELNAIVTMVANSACA